MNLDEREPVPEPSAEAPDKPVAVENGNADIDPMTAPASETEFSGDPIAQADHSPESDPVAVAEPPAEPVGGTIGGEDIRPDADAPALAPSAAFPSLPREGEPPPWIDVPRKERHILRTSAACFAAALVPGLGHAVLGKWDRAVVFMGTIIAMFALGVHLNGRLFSPDFSDLFAALKFIADAGTGLVYWISWLRGLGIGEPEVYTYDFANVFIYVAGLLNMLVIVDAFDIAQERKP